MKKLCLLLGIALSCPQGNSQIVFFATNLPSRVGTDYFGFYDAAANATCLRKLFNAPTTELPEGIHFDQTWTRTVDFPDCLDVSDLSIQLAVHFTSHSEVDAYGTVVLPGIGEVPALRVNEVNTYVITAITFGFPNPTQIFRNYYWLVRGIGKAVIIGSDSFSSLPPTNLTTAKTFLRVFESNTAGAYLVLRPVVDLRIRLQSGRAILNCRPETNASGYRVETLATRPVSVFTIDTFAFMPVSIVRTDTVSFRVTSERDSSVNKVKICFTIV